MGHERPKIKDMAVVHWQLNVYHQLINTKMLKNKVFFFQGGCRGAKKVEKVKLRIPVESYLCVSIGWRVRN